MMATSLPYLAFNSTDDHTFLALLNHTTSLALVDILPILPSTLNLTSDCLASTSLFESSFIADQNQQLLQLADGLRPAFPEAFRNATLLQICNYWGALSNFVPSASNVIQSAFNYCKASGRSTIPLASLNMTQNCSATMTLWNAISGDAAGSGLAAISSPSEGVAGSFFRASLPVQYQNVSSWTLLDYVQPLISNSSFLALLGPAATRCEPSACEAIAFSGDADVGGIGVSISRRAFRA